jgi:hypothetical protein
MSSSDSFAGKSESVSSGETVEKSSRSVEQSSPINEVTVISPAAGTKSRGRPFAPGNSGNPNGRPRGSRNKATLAAEALLEGEADTLTRKLIEKAKEGDIGALRYCLDRISPPRRDRLVAVEMPEVSSAQDASKAAAAVLAACAAGEISTGEASELMNLVTSYVRLLEVGELESRLQIVEAAAGISS